MLDDSGAELITGEKKVFFHLLDHYADVFAGSTADLGWTEKVRHSIFTGDTASIQQPVHRFPPHRREEVRNLLDEMLERGVVE